MQFSNRGFISSAYPALGHSQVGEIIKTPHDGGITCFDTAEIHGRGTSERRLSMGLQHVLETARRLGVTLIAYSPLASAC